MLGGFYNGQNSTKIKGKEMVRSGSKQIACDYVQNLF